MMLSQKAAVYVRSRQWGSTLLKQSLCVITGAFVVKCRFMSVWLGLAARFHHSQSVTHTLTLGHAEHMVGTCTWKNCISAHLILMMEKQREWKRERKRAKGQMTLLNERFHFHVIITHPVWLHWSPAESELWIIEWVCVCKCCNSVWHEFISVVSLHGVPH